MEPSPSLNTKAQHYLSHSHSSLAELPTEEEFLGNFDEDGSFIGDYLEYQEREAKDVENKLKVFQAVYSKTATESN